MCDTFDSHLPPHASISLAFSASIFAKTCWGGGGGGDRARGVVVVWARGRVGCWWRPVGVGGQGGLGEQFWVFLAQGRRADRSFIHRPEVSGQLLELGDRLLALRLSQVAVPEVEHRVEMRRVCSREVVCRLPLEVVDAHLDRSVDPASLHEHLERLRV